MSMNRNKLADLDRRAAVPALTLALLSRCDGLDLIHKPEDQAQYVTKTEHLGYRPGALPATEAANLPACVYCSFSCTSLRS